MRLKTAGALLAAVLLPCLAGAGDVKKDFDSSYDFSKVKTFATKIGTSWGNPLSEKRATNAISEALVARGWKPVAEAEAADALVVLHGVGETQKTLNTFYNGVARHGYGGRGDIGMGTGMGGTLTTTTSENLVGTLVVDIFDARTSALTFRGTAPDETADTPAKHEKKLAKIMNKMFKGFPPGSKK